MTASMSAEDVRAIAEQVVDVLEERGLLGATPVVRRVLDAEQVAAMLGVARNWVYQHRVDLGAFPFGDGPKARLGFDLDRIEDWKNARRAAAHQEPAPAHARRRRGAGRGRTVEVERIPYEEGQPLR